MTITVQCPGCQSKLNAPPTAAGKKVKCPKCQALLVVPGNDAVKDFEVVDDDFEVVDDAPAKPGKRKVVDDDEEEPRKPVKRKSVNDDEDDEPRKPVKRKIVDEDDEDNRPRRRREEVDDEDDRPRKKKRTQKSSSGSGSRLLLYIGGGVLLLIIAGCGGLMLLGYGAAKKVKDAVDKAAAETWVRFDAPDASFNVMLPNTPTTTDDLAMSELLGINQEDAKKAHEFVKASGIAMSSWMATDGTRKYVISTAKLPKAIPNPAAIEDGVRDITKKEYQKIGKVQDDETAMVAGRSIKWLRVKTNNGKTMVSSMIYVGDRVFTLSLIDDGDVTTSDANAKKFIDSFNSTRSIPAEGDAPAKGKDAKRRGAR